MKRGAGVWIIGIMLGALFYGAMVSTPMVLASGVNDNKVYDDFWRILNDEAHLVVSFNESLHKGTPNATLARELIDNSRRGELNSANISAQIWLALQELRKAGVKLYYSADELRQMAEEIKSNGLPPETVNELKAQGWTDDEIRALEEYIARNSDSITSGFDMGSFLTNFSKAFVMVGFKYADYETWALERWKWNRPLNSSHIVESYKNSPRKIVPDLSNDWSKFYHAYLSNDVNGMSFYLGSLVKDTDSLILNSGGTPVEHGGIVFGKLSENGVVGSRIVVSGKDYYWPGALEAYKQLRRVYVLVTAMKLGNSNPELRAMLNREVAILKDSLVAYVGSNVSPPPNPHPLPCLPGKCDVTLSTSGKSQSGTVSKTSPSPATDIALDVNSNYGYIDDVEVTLEKSLDSSGHVEYRIRVQFSVERNTVSNVKITLTTPDGEDSVSYSALDTGQHTWTSKTFVSSGVISSPGDSVSITGSVSIDYTSTDSPAPNSAPISPAVSPTSGPREGSVDKSFNFRVTYDDFVKSSNVRVSVTPQPSSILENGQVTFRLTVENNNGVSIQGHWRATIEIPDENGVVSTAHYSGELDVGRNSSSTVTIATVSYPKAGDYRYSVTYYFGDNSKTVDGTVHVDRRSGGSPSYRLWIKDVTITPDYPKEGDVVSFNVGIGSSYRDTERALVKLYIDGELKDSREVSVGSSGTSVSLHWPAVAGEHSYEVKLYRLVNGQESLVDSNRQELLMDLLGGRVNVRKANQQFAIKLEAFPKELEGGEVFFTVRVWNFENQAISLSGFVEDEDGAVVKKIDGFEGRVPANAQNYTLTAFSLDVYGVGNHTYRLFLDNTDGKPNGKGEEHWSEVKVEVKPAGNIIASMDCSPAVVPLDGSTTCTVHFELKSADTVTLNLEEVDFGGKKVWPNGPSSVTVNKQTVTLTPTNMQEDLTVTITVNDELADYYFEKSPWLSTGSYKDRFSGYSYLVKTMFSNNIEVGTIVSIIDDSSAIEKLETGIKVVGAAESILEEVAKRSGQLKFKVVVSGSLGRFAVIGSKFLGVVGWGLTLRDAINWFRAPTPSDGDNNNVIGG